MADFEILFERGDLDPCDPLLNDEDMCGARFNIVDEETLAAIGLMNEILGDQVPPYYQCTWAKGHSHPQHVAAGLDKVVAVWPNVDLDAEVPVND